ncbi:MAG: hypothetical protein R3F14_02960 [Polyangiaceae bacterium]
MAIRSAKERKQALESAASRNDADLANHEFHHPLRPPAALGPAHRRGQPVHR